jgi:hypothetical protein
MTLQMTWQRVIDHCRSKPRLTLAVGVALSLGLAWLSQPRAERAVESEASIDTFIPGGQVLIPIVVHNSESVDSIFGNHGVVDLYPVSPGGTPQKWPLARAVKMLRAPKNPNQFGVLVPAAQAARVMSSGGTFQVVIHNPKIRGTVFEKVTSKPARPIIVEED